MNILFYLVDYFLIYLFNYISWCCFEPLLSLLQIAN